MTDLIVFRNDLRLTDNPTLAFHADASALLCVYVREPVRPWCHTLGPGPQRRRFLQESLVQLQQQLRSIGQELLVVEGDSVQQVMRLVNQFRVQRVGIADSPGVYEKKLVDQLRERLGVPVMVHPSNSLYSGKQVRELMPELPQHFTPFRNAIQDIPHRPAAVVASLPPLPKGLRVPSLEAGPLQPHPTFIVRGGEAEAERRLRTWLFRERAIENYKDTRNQLDGLYASSGLSPWLANGALSVRTVADALDDYEKQYGVSSSSEHLRQELLWREYFHWRAMRGARHLFRAGGAQGRVAKCCFEPRSFARWCAGDTDFPLVNALMHQLVESGWMSNRGRQVAASCLINELAVDWRYGAAFFEKHLIDYEVASNYGNWQYIAGVGADPRGGRHFNLALQAERYDPEGDFTLRWKGYRPKQPKHVVDAADWPITQAPEPDSL